MRLQHWRLEIGEIARSAGSSMRRSERDRGLRCCSKRSDRGVLYLRSVLDLEAYLGCILGIFTLDLSAIERLIEGQ